MDDNSELHPESFRIQCKKAIEVIDKENEAYEELINKLRTNIVENDLIAGETADSIKAYASDLIMVVGYAIKANELDKPDYQVILDSLDSVLTDKVDKNEVLRGDEIHEEKRYIEGIIADYEEVIDLLDQMKGDNTYYKIKQSDYEEQKEDLKKIIDDLNNKEERYDSIDAETKMLFSDTSEIRRIAIDAICSISQFLNEKGVALYSKSVFDLLSGSTNQIAVDGKSEDLLIDYLIKSKNEDGTNKYTDEEIRNMVNYVRDYYSHTFESLCHIPSQYCGFVVETCGKYAEEYLMIEKYNNLLLKSGWDPNYINFNMTREMYNTLENYNINTREQICAFIGECMFESDYGRGLTEYGTDDYFNGNGYGTLYRGGGYIHITWKYGYQAYATYLILNKYPKLKKEFNYLNPKEIAADLIENNYNYIIETAQKYNINTTVYKKIVDEGAEYVADNYAWEVAGYFWEINMINEAIENGCTIDDVSKLINPYDSSSFEDRSVCYNSVLQVYDEIF